MVPLNIRLDVYHHFPDPVPPQQHDSRLDQLLTLVTQIKGDTTKIMDKEQQELDALAAINTATNKIATNLSVVVDVTTSQGTVITTISTELDTLLAALQSAGVSQAILDQTAAIGSKASAAADASDAAVAALQAQIPVLQAMATKGSGTPVPVPPPPPPPPPPTA